MSLDITLTATRKTTVFDRNITHNLKDMAEQVGLNLILWHADELDVTSAGQLIGPLEEGLAQLIERRQELLKYNAANGWGKYEDLLNFVAGYLAACKENPDAEIEISR